MNFSREGECSYSPPESARSAWSSSSPTGARCTARLLEPGGPGRYRDELTDDQWRAVLAQAAELGVLQVHFSGGEPWLGQSSADLSSHAAALGMYTNLVTSGVR